MFRLQVLQTLHEFSNTHNIISHTACILCVSCRCLGVFCVELRWQWLPRSATWQTLPAKPRY